MNFRKRGRSRRNSLSIMINTEKWKQNRKISRTDTYRADDNDDDDPKYKEIKDWVEEFFNRKSECPDKIDQDVEVRLTRKQTLILSTLVPDEILLMDKFDTTEPKRFVGVLLMADVSGYTALSERYNNTGKGGTYRLTVTLNTYLGSLVEVIYSHGGDIIKFAGDAFLALWKTDKSSFIGHTIHKVIACALIIQHSYSSYETDVKVNLKVKLAISAGNLLFAPIGHGVDMNYVIFGLPVLEAKAAESVCDSGEVKLTATAWGHCYSRNYDHVVNDDGHVTIKSILYDPHDKDVSKPFTGFGPLMKQVKRFSTENFPSYLWESPEHLSASEIVRKNEVLRLRKAILRAEERNIGCEIRKFLIRPVLTQIDAHQPLEYLTEMRQVSVLFMTLKLRECPFLQLITIVNNSYEITCKIVYKSMGCVNKIILFDKDVMILVIFGLRGFKHESEAQAALKCAYSIKKSISALDGVLEVSIGLTTGQVYCGVVGHPLRREFTIIGAVVNKAARLMCAFRNKITCDENTFMNSKMTSNGFTLQSKIDLKGIIQPGKIYEYSEEIRVKALYDIPMTPPLLNRNDELEYFENWLDNSHLSHRELDALLLMGDPGIGRSRMLQWMTRKAQNRGYKTCFINLTTVHSATPYLALSQIVNQLLELEDPIIGFVKEEKIVKLMKVYDEDLCYLNNLIKVRFAYHERIDAQNETVRNEKSKKIFMKLIACLTDSHIIFLDDLQNLDSYSWDFICTMFTCMKIFTVLSVSRGKFISVQNWLYDVFVNNSIRKIVLGPISPNLIAPLACQILDVDAVPNDLCNALRLKCNGIPGVIENFIIHLFSNGAIELKKIGLNEIQSWKREELQFPEAELLHPQAININDQITLDEHIRGNSSEHIVVCTVIQKEMLKANIDVQNIDALVMIQIDSLTPYQQLLLKISSVIGTVVSRDLLENIMYENDPLTTAKSIKRLYAMRILCCANVKSVPSSIDSLVCGCSFFYDSDNEDNLPKYAYCNVMKFRNKNTRKTCYELLPLNQKKEFHSRIVQYLETKEQKCPDCGGVLTVIQSINSVQSECSNYVEKSDTSLRPSSIDEESEINILTINSNNRDPSTTAQKSISEQMLQTSTFSKYPKRAISEMAHDQKASGLDIIKSRITSILRTKTNSSEINHKSTSKTVTMTNLSSNKNKSSSDILDTKVYDMLRLVIEAKTISDWHNIGVIDSEDNVTQEKYNKNSCNIKLEKKLSSTNISKCTCADLNVMLYEQLIHHALQAEMKLKALQFTIMLCYLYLMNNDFEIILPHLEEAEKMCLDKQIPQTVISDFEKQRYLGKVHSIRAAVFLNTEKLMAAKYEVEKATRIYHINLYNVSDFFKFSKVISVMKRKNKRKKDSILKADSIFCLNVATVLYSSLEEDKTARISAFRALEIIQNMECKVIDVCDALTNAIEVEMDREAFESIINIERLACTLLQRLPPVRIEELFSIGKLFMAIFRARMARGQIPSTIRAGFRALTVSRFLQADNVSLDIIPDLFYVLLSRRRINEAVDIVQLALRLGQYQSSHDCETWYYALCIDMILDAGFQMETPYEISRYAEYALGRGRSAGPSRRRLVVGLWTYWLRADFERKAKSFESEALSWANHNADDGSLTSLMSALRLADGMLESLARKVDDLRKVCTPTQYCSYNEECNKVVDMMEHRSLADRELNRLEKDARLMRVIYPRWILLRANSLYLSGRHTTANNTLNQGLEEARRLSNRLEESLARAALSNSKFWVQSARNGRFPEWQEGAEQARAAWHQMLYKATRQL